MTNFIFSSCSTNCIYHYLVITIHKYHNKLSENITLIGHDETDSPDRRQIVERLGIDKMTLYTGMYITKENILHHLHATLSLPVRNAI